MKKPTTCNFCGKKISDNPDSINDLMFAGMADNGEPIAICGTCVQNGYKILQESLEDFNKDEDDENDQEKLEINPMILKDRLDKWIIGQEKAKKRLAIAVYDHYKRINQKENKTDVKIEKSNIILVGSTGCGKTAMMKALATELNLPLYIEDVTTITTTGYVGRSVDDILIGLLSKADGDLELAQKGIILLDEGDKLKREANATGTRDVKGEGVQQGLLKITEGGVFNIKYRNKNIKFDTSNVLFVLAGAFEGIEKIIAKRKNAKFKTTIGFTGNILKKDDDNNAYNDYILDVNHEDLKEFGMMPELLGRFPIITPLQELSIDALAQILTEPKNAIMQQLKKSFAMDNIELTYKDESLKAIAKIAKERKIGARALRSIVEEIVEDAKFECPGSEIKEVVIKDDLSLEYIKEQEN